MRRAGLLLALVVALAGCAAPPEEPAVAFAPAEPLVADHDHARPEGHDVASGLALAAHIEIATILGGEPGRLSDLQFHGDLAAVAVNGGSGGFVLLDARDPLHPAPVGRYRSGTEDNWYVKFTPDGRFVLLTANGALSAGPAAQGALAAVASATPTGAARGLHVVDVTDPRSPRLAAAYAAPVRLINAQAVEQDGETYVFASVVEDRLPQGLPPSGALPNDVRILRLREGPLGVTLEEVARWTPERVPGGTTLVHDVAVERHPLTGRTILYAACWDAGVALVDVTDPSRPATLATFRPPDAPPAGLQTHTVKPHPGLVEGRHLTLAAPETFGGEASGSYLLLDTTDPAHPALLDTWRLPGDLVNDAPLLWSPHEFSLEGGRASTSNYHAGTWTLDLTGGRLTPVAAYARGGEADPARAKWSLDAETAVRHAGLVYVVDMGRGLDVLREE